MEMNLLCVSAAPNLKPSYLERFQAWKQRLGPYYQRYQQLKELIALVEEQAAQRMQELRKNRREERALCMLMGNAILDSKNDEELKRFVNEVAGK